MLSRLALRIAVCEALAPHGASVFPTIAGKHVYDSRIDPAAGLDEIEAIPMVIVYTEEHEGRPYSGRNPADRQTVTLTIECLIATRVEVTITDDSGATQTIGGVEAPPTDAEREALLDLLEAEVRRALDPREMRPASALLSQVLWETTAAQSVPLRDADRTTRFAQRSLQLAVQIPNDAWPDPGAPRGTGLDALPEPLRGVARALPEGSPHKAICALVAARVAGPAALTPMQGLTVYANVDRATAPTDQPGEHDLAGEFDNP